MNAFKHRLLWIYGLCFHGLGVVSPLNLPARAQTELQAAPLAAIAECAPEFTQELSLSGDGKNIPASLASALVQDQGEVGVCYASAASLVLEALSGQPISALDLAGIHKASLPKHARDRQHFLTGKFSTVQGGSLCGVIRAVNAWGACVRDRSWLESRLPVSLNGPDRVQSDPLNTQAIFISHLESFLRMRARLSASDLETLHRDRDAASESLEPIRHVSERMQALKGTDAPEPIEALGLFDPADLDGLQDYQKWIAPDCAHPGKRIPFPRLRCDSHPVAQSHFQDPAALRDFRLKVLESLRRGLPAGLVYCPNALNTPDRAVYDQGCLVFKKTGFIIGQHVSVISGLRRNASSGRCEYQVWNSWGALSGKQWVDERLLIRNSRQLQIVHPEAL